MVCCSSTGEKLKPFLIGTAKTPNCFRDNKGKTQNILQKVSYKFNRTAWMTGAFFKEWAEELNQKMKNENRKVVLLIDNASSHSHLVLSNVKLVFLPANTTGVLQPLDVGIIRMVKVYARKIMLQFLCKIVAYCLR